MHSLRFFLATLCLVVTTAMSSAQTTTTTNPPIFKHFDDIAHLFAQQNDTTYVINFWATWCKPCVAELPYLDQLTVVYADQPLKVILVSLDFPQLIEKNLLPFLEKNQLHSEVIVLTDGKYNDWISRVEDAWDGAIPVTLIYKNDQRTFLNQEVASFEELNALVAPYLK